MPKLLIVFLLVALTACQNDNGEKSVPKSPTALTPAETVKKFQGYIDSNDFQKAIQLSTPEMTKVLSSLGELFQEDTDDAGITVTTFLDIKCTIKNNTAQCNCSLRDEYEDYSSIFYLKKVKDKWLIDNSEDSYSDEDEEIEIFDVEEKTQ